MPMKKPRRNSGFSWIEFLVVAMILLVVARPVFAVIFPGWFRRIDDEFHRWLGINPEIARFFLGIAFVIFCIVKVCW